MDEDDELHLELHREADTLGKFAILLHLQFPDNFGKKDALRFMDNLLSNITKACVSKGADIVGHIKAFMKSDTGSIMGSLVDPSVGVNLTDNLQDKTMKNAEIYVHVIVHNLWDPQVREYSLETIKQVLSSFKISYTIDRDYYETEKSIAHHLPKGG